MSAGPSVRQLGILGAAAEKATRPARSSATISGPATKALPSCGPAPLQQSRSGKRGHHVAALQGWQCAGHS